MITTMNLSTALLWLALVLSGPRIGSVAFVLHKHVGRYKAAHLTLFGAPDDSSSIQPKALKGLDVAIVGAGPSGLLLAHKLLQGGAKVSVFESRSRPLEASKEARAYALGIGMRGRTAIQSVDTALWNSVKSAGFPSERFNLHVGPFRIGLRDGSGPGSETQEPSVLFYQTDLCRVLAEELEKRWTPAELNLKYDVKVADIDLQSCSLEIAGGQKQDFDLVVGCDGVNSIVRSAMENEWSEFDATKQVLPGEVKVARLGTMPPKLDPAAVALLLPKGGSCTAFVEPTTSGSCILFAGKNSTDTLLASTDTDELKRTILERFPLLEGAPVEDAAEQLAQAKLSKAASVVCNTYHYKNSAVLVGDAAHATGGVSGQGANSALMDSKVLAECLVNNFTPAAFSKEDALNNALLNYSQRQVPEGRALYDLSFGPKPESLRKRIWFSFVTTRDSILRGRWGIGRVPLPTLLTTSLVPFSEIRRQRDQFYCEEFPTDSEWNGRLSDLASTAEAQSNPLVGTT